mmetsp:Transcript_5239/g.11067  ORF Transcript_5239/g.11067 Transcript_5239/m.11067 type:complete len:267 (-) Transcript_5239:139-939(-)
MGIWDDDRYYDDAQDDPFAGLVLFMVVSIIVAVKVLCVRHCPPAVLIGVGCYVFIFGVLFAAFVVDDPELGVSAIFSAAWWIFMGLRKMERLRNSSEEDDLDADSSTDPRQARYRVTRNGSHFARVSQTSSSSSRRGRSSRRREPPVPPRPSTELSLVDLHNRHRDNNNSELPNSHNSVNTKTMILGSSTSTTSSPPARSLLSSRQGPMVLMTTRPPPEAEDEEDPAQEQRGLALLEHFQNEPNDSEDENNADDDGSSSTQEDEQV